MTPLQRAALLDPVRGDDQAEIDRRRLIVDIGQGELLTRILAVDR